MAGVGLLGQIAGNAAISAGGEIINEYRVGKGYSISSIATASIIGGVSGACGGRGIDRSGLTKQGTMAVNKSAKALLRGDKVAFKRAWRTYARMSRYAYEEMPEVFAKANGSSFATNLAAKMYQDYENGTLGR